MGRVLVSGQASGEALVLTEPLSLWGGVDVSSGRVIDAAHPQHGSSVTGKILVMPHGRGSSSSSYVLAEMLRRGTGPAGLVLEEPDGILTVGSLVARALYQVDCPVIVAAFPGETGQIWAVRADEHEAALSKLSLEDEA